MVVGDVNCFLTTPIPINILNQGTNNGGCTAGTNIVPATFNSECNPNGIFTGLNYFDINLPFLWSLVGKCQTCP